MFGWLLGKKSLQELHEVLGQLLAVKFGKEGVNPQWTAKSEASRKGYKLLVVLGWNPEWPEERLKSQVQRVNDECRSFAEKSKKSLLISGPHLVAGGALALFIGLTPAV